MKRISNRVDGILDVVTKTCSYDRHELYGVYTNRLPVECSYNLQGMSLCPVKFDGIRYKRFGKSIQCSYNRHVHITGVLISGIYCIIISRM